MPSNKLDPSASQRLGLSDPAASGATSGPDGGKLIDLSWLATLAWRHKWAMLLAILAVLAATALAYALAVKKYDASVVLALDRGDQQLVRTAQSNKDTIVDSPAVDTEVQVLLSPEVAAAAVHNARLNTNSAFLAASAPDAVGPLSEAAAANILRANLTVARQGLSYAINLGYRSRDPQVSAMVANAVADAYVSGQVQGEQNARSQDINMLRSRLDQLRGDVIKAEAAVASYRASADLVAVSNDSTIAQQELSTLNTELASAKAELAASQGRASANAGENGTAVNSSPVIRDLRTEVSTLEVKLAEQSSTLGPNHPDRVRTEAQLNSARQSLRREVSRASAGVSSDVKVDSQRVGAIQAAIGGAKGRLLAGNNASVRLNELERVAESSRQLYQTFLDRYRVELATRGTEKSKAQVIARAQVPPRPSSPDLLVYMLGGGIAGVIAAVLLALTLEWRERGIRTRAEAEELTGYEVVSSLPDIATMDEPDFHKDETLGVPDFLVEHKDSPFAESVRAIWTALKIGHKGQVARSVGITSSIPGEGKTSTAIALARSAALAGRRTLLIDCDVRRMGTTIALDLRGRPGLAEVLTGEARVEDVLVVDEPSGAHVLPLNSTAQTPLDIIHSDATATLFDRFRQEYDLVVLDIAPVIPVAEARALAAMADVTLMILRWRTTQRNVVRTALRELDGLAEGRFDAAWTGPLRHAFLALGRQRDGELLASKIQPLLESMGGPSIPTVAPPMAGTGTEADADIDAGASTTLAETVRMTPFQIVLVELIGFATAPDDRPEAGPVRKPARALAYLGKRLDTLHRQVVRGGERFESLAPGEQHRVRKRLKRLRYIVEFVGPLFDTKEAARYLKKLTPAQDRLGDLNDMQVAAEAYRRLAVREPRAWFGVGWLQASRPDGARESRRALAKIADARRFWRDR